MFDFDLLNQELQYLKSNLQRTLDSGETVTHNLLIKQLSIFIITKLETFITIIYNDRVKKINASDDLVSNYPDIKKEIFKYSLEYINENPTENNQKLVKMINNLQVKCNGELKFNELEFDFEFPFYHNGSKAISKYFSTVHINVFDVCDSFEYFSNDTYMDSHKTIEYKGIIDRMIQYRNIIVHDDIIPENLNSVNLLFFVDIILSFMRELHRHINSL